MRRNDELFLLVKTRLTRFCEKRFEIYLFLSLEKSASFHCNAEMELCKHISQKNDTGYTSYGITPLMTL